MDNRKTITTAARLALWEAHGRKCAYTGDPVAWSELEIDHIIPVKGDAARKTELHGAGIIGADFDIKGFENLLPTKALPAAEALPLRWTRRSTLIIVHKCVPLSKQRLGHSAWGIRTMRHR